MAAADQLTLINPLTQTALLQVRTLGNATDYTQWQHLTTYSVFWLEQGEGQYETALQTTPFGAHTLLFFPPAQPFRLIFHASAPVQGVALHFVPDFYCLEKHQAEVACKGVLFDTLLPPAVVHAAAEAAAITNLLELLRTEMQQPALAQRELLVSYLKILLIQASRLRIQQSAGLSAPALRRAQLPVPLQKLEELIEQHYREKHTPADYADLLHLSRKALGNLTRLYYGRTVTSLIQERIVLEAKRELYLTTNPIKEIAFNLGFRDQHYFSRFFKHTTTIAPQLYREQVNGEQVMLKSRQAVSA